MRGGRVVAHGDLTTGAPVSLQSLLTPSGRWIRAWKVAIAVDGDRWRSLSGRHTFGEVEVATCIDPVGANRPDHAAPGLDCTCGFHAVTDPSALPVSLAPEGAVLLDVRLGGRFVARQWHRGALVVRGERQRVVGVHDLQGDVGADAPWSRAGGVLTPLGVGSVSR